EHLTRDLVTLLGEQAVEHFPAWETLPFERMSPTVETMGRRLRTLWRLRHPQFAPAVLVAPVRALVQRLGPHVDDVDPVFVRRGATLDPVALVERLVAMGYRREYQVEHRGEVAVRGSIVDVFPSTADVPLRLDFWGDELDRLTEFSVADQRATQDVEVAAVFPCRELLPTPDVRARAEELVAREPWGREHWERLGQGLTFDGMESWLPWLVDAGPGRGGGSGGAPAGSLVTDLLPDDGLGLLVEPRRVRERAADSSGEEADLARTLARTWGAVPAEQAARAGDGPDDNPFPQLHLPFDQLLAHTEAPVWSMTVVPEGPGITTVQ